MAREAFEAVRDGDWDLVLMDIAMPEMTGLGSDSGHPEATGRAQQGSGTTVIAMTASVLKEETDHYLQTGHGRVRAQALQGGAACWARSRRAHASDSLNRNPEDPRWV